MPHTANPPRPSIREENTLLDILIHDAFDLYCEGDYGSAVNRLLDARAIQAGRVDWQPFEAFVAVLESHLAHAELPLTLAAPNHPRAVQP